MFFLTEDSRRLDVGDGIFTSAFYFLLPSLGLIIFYHPYPRWLKAFTLLGLGQNLLGGAPWAGQPAAGTSGSKAGFGLLVNEVALEPSQ